MKGKFKKSLALFLGLTLCAATIHMTTAVNAAETTPDVSLNTSISSAISQDYVVKPASGQTVSLDKLVLRYYYEKSGSKPQAFSCDSAGLSLSVSPYYVDFTKNVTGKFTSDCLEIGFTGNYSLANGSLSFKTQIHQSDWSAYENVKEKKFEVVYNDKVVQTIRYDGSTPNPTSTPVVTPTPSKDDCVIPKCNVDQNGPFAVTIDKNVGPNGKGWIVRPSNLCTLGVAKHPIFIWNPGGGDKVSLYEGQMKRWASQGFVVYSEESQWSGQQCVDALDWIVKQNENSQCPVYHKLDVSRIAAGGFSLGSVGAYAVASDPRIKTTIHCDGGSFDGSGSSKWRNPTCVMNGLADGGLASNNTNRDYSNAKVPIWYGGIIGGGHGSTVWDGGDAITGWLRWQLAGDKDMRNMFLTPGGRFNNGKFKSQWKNW